MQEEVVEKSIDKRKRGFPWFLVLVFVIALIVIAFYVSGVFDFSLKKMNFDDAEEVLLGERRNIEETGNVIPDDFPDAIGLHWGHMPLTYGFAVPNESNSNVNCQEHQVNRVIKAFEIVTNETGGAVNFLEGEGDVDIEIYCNKAQAEGPGYMVLGDGGYEAYGNVIFKGTLNFYTHRNCGTWPDMEVHEVLHTLGFEHIDDKKSIMYYEQVRCDAGKIDDEIVDKLIGIYSQ